MEVVDDCCGMGSGVKFCFNNFELEFPHILWEIVVVADSGIGVTVVEAPTSFSPFPSTDCTLYSHFSFDDFVTIAFPDLTRNLDNQI